MKDRDRIIDFFTRVSTFVPPAIMLVLMIISLFDIKETGGLAEDFGLSTFVFIPLFCFYFNRRFKFCSFTKASLIGLFINHVIYKIGDFVDYSTYDRYYTISCGVFTAILTCIMIYRNKKTA